LVVAVLETHQVALELMVRTLYFLPLLRLVVVVVLVMGLTHP
jgi:ABC-type sugar transport system permease subunit